MAEGNKVVNLFAEFTRLRQTGFSRDDAWDTIESQTEDLTQNEMARLFSLLRGWEAKEGRNFKPTRADDPHETQYTPPEGLEEMREEHAVNQQARSRKNVIRRIAPAQSNVAADGTTCPHCGKINRAGELYCYACGEMLLRAGGTRAMSETQPVDGTESHASYFGDSSWLYIQVHGDKRVMRLQPKQAEMVIGRKSPDSVMIPDIDLSPFNAEEQGVSRLHAALRRQNDTLVVSDMGSLNHTHINGQRLHAHEVRVLHDGDELRFGQLKVRVFFREE